MGDPSDRGDYRCFIALAARDDFAGLCIIAVAPLGFGPLADQTVACLENILVPTRYRRQGIGTALLQRGLGAAWQSGAAHLWWTAEYENLAAIAFYKCGGAVFIAEEDPASDKPQKCYAVVVANPNAAIRKASIDQTVQPTGASRSAAQSNRASTVAGSRR
jgi:hypothetical protein